jgi:branched-chain amino acid transport system substrate-binding protein
MSVEVVTADHQNKPDVGASIARQWIDQEGVTMILDVPTSSVAFAVQGICNEKNIAFINTGAGSSDLTGKSCSPTFIHWSYDTWMTARSNGGAMVKSGGDTWFFVTADYVFGHQLQDDTTALLKKAGGKVLGSVTYPFPGTSDFSSFLLQAQSSGAKVLGFCNAGADTVNCIKQAHEFGLNNQMRLAAMLMFINDVHALTLEVAQGLSLTESFYWDLNDRTRAWTQRVLPKLPNGNYPNMTHAGDYAGTLHYLKAVADMGVPAAKDGRAVVARMKAMPVEDDCFGKTRIREDGRHLADSLLLRVKKPSESKKPWDYFDVIAITPAEEAFRPLAEGNCKLVHS